jgi:GDP-4-dehydro-6-deoxy-D-mannose reductase
MQSNFQSGRGVRKLLIIGGTGFVGSQLARHCFDFYNICKTGRDVDIRNTEQLRLLIDRVKPDHVIHLAAITSLKESFQNPSQTFEINFGGTLNLLTALHESGFNGKFLFVSSSEVYGALAENDLPVDELKLTKPLSPYGISKIASEALCYQWSQREQFKIIIARPFNHIGAGQSERFAIANFGRQVAKIKLGLEAPVIYVGDIDTTRDFTDVRDIVAAYVKLLDLGQNGEIYNVCSGVERTVRSLVERMCQLAGVTMEIRLDFERFRLNEQRRVCGDNRKIIGATGWSLSHSIDQTLVSILEDWTYKIKIHEC